MLSSLPEAVTQNLDPYTFQGFILINSYRKMTQGLHKLFQVTEKEGPNQCIRRRITCMGRRIS